MGDTLKNKVAVVTGGSSGIGFAIARRFIQEGAFVFFTGRRPDAVKRAEQELGGRSKGLVADASSPAALAEVYAQVAAAGPLHIVVANAGGAVAAPLGAITEKMVDEQFGTNVKGVIFTVQSALPLLQAGASVILIGSSTAVMGTAALSVYSATKAAVRNLARSWILDVKGRGIRINVLSPGPTRTPGLLGVAPEGQGEAMVASFASALPIGRVADPVEVAEVALFLASDAASFVQGAEVFVDGGLAQI